jgi:hypothetical protein
VARLTTGRLARLLARAAHTRRFFNTSLDGGLELFELFRASRRSSSARCAFGAAISGLRVDQRYQLFPARLGSLGVARITQPLIRKPTLPSR